MCPLTTIMCIANELQGGKPFIAKKADDYLMLLSFVWGNCLFRSATQRITVS